jgi:metal-responsive CopG/Arc/MetJ family transcriptional regulator
LSTTKRINISVPESLLEQAKATMEVRAFEDFSGFIQQLIREEYERRHGPQLIQETSPPYKAIPKQPFQENVPGTKKQKAKHN